MPYRYTHVDIYAKQILSSRGIHATFPTVHALLKQQVLVDTLVRVHDYVGADTLVWDVWHPP